MPENKTIYGLSMHSRITIEKGNHGFYEEARRVPGGWIYYYYENDALVNTQFVPWCSRDMDKERGTRIYPKYTPGV